MVVKGFREFVRTAAAEGAVLLKNEGVLPVRNERAAVFGRTQIDYYKSGTGSGGAVNSLYVPNILDALRENEYITVDEEIAALYETLTQKYPLNHTNRFEADFEDKELEISEKEIERAASRNDKAIIVIGRVAGEAYDNANAPGSFLLTKNEKKLIGNVAKYFENFAVILNTGNIIDMRWVDEFRVPAVMYIWQGGEEGARACADVLSGIVNPCGKLGDTIARRYEDYPSAKDFETENEVVYSEDIFVGYRYFETFAKDKVLYPFGFGLSYGDFNIKVNTVIKWDTKLDFDIDVKNIGSEAGKEVVQLYLAPPCGRLGRPSRELCAFAKTALIRPRGLENLQISLDLRNHAAFDDVNSRWVLEKGRYRIFAGRSIRDAYEVFSYVLDEEIVVKQCRSYMPPVKKLSRMVNNNGIEGHEMLAPKSKPAADEIPAEFNANGFTGNFADAVKENKIKEFIATLTNEELAALSRGEGMLSPKVTAGTASCFGGVTDGLVAKGIPTACTSDGPSGIRMDNGEAATSMPGGAALACTWDTKLIEKLYEFEGKELVLNKIDMLLGPGMNIHRNPLCGRNFEYYSEDPLLTGMLAAAAIRGIDKGGAMGVIKHFACNNREYNRYNANAVVSERALREIYLRPFEIAIKSAPVVGVMTSYNPINGIQASSSRDLADGILRREWKYDGFVMTDWWPHMNNFVGDSPSPRKLAAMARSHNDVYMVVSNFRAGDWEDDIAKSLSDGALTRAELQRNVYSTLDAISKMNCFERMHGFKRDTKCGKDWFRCGLFEREYEIRECSIPKMGTRKRNVLVDMVNIEGKGASHKFDVTAKPGDEAVLTLVGERNGMAVLTLDMGVNAQELAQLGVFIEYDGKTYPISLRGTNGEIITTEPIEIAVAVGWHEMKIGFGKSNMADIRFTGISIMFI